MSSHMRTRHASGKKPAIKAVVAFCVLGLLLSASVAVMWAQVVAGDPGVRGGPSAAGAPLRGLTVQERSYFDAGLEEFADADSVRGTISGEPGRGLGPRFNLNSCGGCHAQPALGGSSPFINPQVAVANLDGATNIIPSFITDNGPVRVARFKFKADGTRDGGAHDLYTITGRSDAPGCSIAQPDFGAAAANDNLIFRIPTPVFGAGLIETIEDAALIRNQSSNLAAKRALGISGRANRNGNDGTVARFGWKAQNKSLQLFAAEAYNVEQGVTNEIFPSERDETPGCLFNGTPEDHTNFGPSSQDATSDVVRLAIFMRFLAPPPPAPDTPSIVKGRALFSQIGCALCHTPTLTTGASSGAALSSKPANLFSDLLVHHMGSGLADSVVQGQAGPDEFRTAPLWGLGQRVFFLHDGRTNDLLGAIQAHASPPTSDLLRSEGNRVAANFNRLSENQKQDILNFLRAL